MFGVSELGIGSKVRPVDLEAPAALEEPGREVEVVDMGFRRHVRGILLPGAVRLRLIRVRAA